VVYKWVDFMGVARGALEVPGSAQFMIFIKEQIAVGTVFDTV